MFKVKMFKVKMFKVKIIFSILFIACYRVLSIMRAPFEASQAVNQLNDSKIDYITSTYLSNHSIDTLHFVILFIIFVIWFKDFKNIVVKLFKKLKGN